MSQHWSITQDTTIPISPDTTVEHVRVDLTAGMIDVIAHDDDAGAQVELSDLSGQVEVLLDQGRLTVRPVSDDSGLLRRLISGRHNVSARVSIAVPASTGVAVNTASAQVLVSGLRANVSVNSASGSTTAENLTGDISLSTASGGIEAVNLSGNLKVNNASGEVVVRESHLPEVKVNSASGDVTLDLVDGASQVKVNSASGDLTVRVPADTGWDLDAKSATGTCVIDGERLETAPGRGGGRSSYGDRRLAIRSRSASGNVTILRRAAEPSGQTEHEA